MQPQSRAPRIFINPSGYRAINLGDHMMLEVAIARLRARWPDASIAVHCLDPAPFLAVDPKLAPIGASGALAWMADVSVLGRASWPGCALRRRLPRVAAAAARLALRAKRRSPEQADTYLRAVREADLVLLTGGGYFNDEFRLQAHIALETMDLAADAGAATALVGQGIGPISDAALRARAAAILPRADLIALREGLTGLPLLRSFGVPDANVVVTGDDAIVDAYRARPRQPGTEIGLNLRVAGYSGIGDGIADTVGAVVREARGRLGAAVAPVPIWQEPAAGCDDLTVAHRMLGIADEPRALTKEQLLAAIARCRIVVAGSYHAAVLALSMGIPAVTIARSAYYRSKMLGLAHQFGPACRVVIAEGPGFAAELAAAIASAWSDAHESREALLSSAARQVDAGEAAYRRLFQLVESRLRQMR